MSEVRSLTALEVAALRDSAELLEEWDNADTGALMVHKLRLYRYGRWFALTHEASYVHEYGHRFASELEARDQMEYTKTRILHAYSEGANECG